MMEGSGFLLDAGLAQRGIAHGFGLRTSPPRAAVRRARQLHGIRVVNADTGAELGEADAVWATQSGVAVGVVTADCVPILVAAEGAAVAAIHAGWRGLAAGVVAAGVRALVAAAPGAPLCAALGPYIGPCCYEVDTPVLEALAARFGAQLAAATRATRPGHALLDLGALVAIELAAEAIAPASIGRSASACTRCDAERFHSHRRDGASAGRLLHWIEAPLRE